MKKIYLTLLLALLSTLGALAETVTIDGIRYELDANTNEATVMSNGQNYSGSITIPSTVTYNSKTYQVTTIGNWAFCECYGLTSITIPNNVTTIGDFAFGYCTGLTSITIPNNVTTIGNSAFLGCTGLTSITIPNSVTTIESLTFNGCTGLISVTIGNSVTSITTSAFYGCTDLTSITVQNGNPQYDSRENCNAIIETATNTLVCGCKNTIIPNSVTSIDNDAFLGCTGLTSITIPNSVTSIGNYAFSDCTGLTTITIPNSVTSIGYNAFANCTGLASITVQNGNPQYDSRDNCNAIIATAINWLVCGCKNTTIPNSVTTIGYSAFQGCTGLTSVTIPNSVTSIGGRAFYGCSGLTSVTIPNSVTTIGGEAFDGCTGLTSIIIPNGVTTIGEAAFYKCSDLTSITIPNSVTYIGDNAFSATAWYNNQPDGLVYAGKVAYNYKGSMPNGTSIVLEDGTLGIATEAFSGCVGLTSIAIPNSVTTIGDRVFNGCTDLTSITVQNGNPKYDSRDNCNAIIETATNSLVCGCKNTTIPSSVTSIGWYAFYGCTGLTSITIPNSVRWIGYQAFYNCEYLSYIRSEIEVPFEIDEYVFKYFGRFGERTIFATLYVPAGTKSAYKATSGWNQLNIEEVVLYPSNICSRENEQVELPVTLDNIEYGENVVGVSFTLQLPEGVSVALDEDGDPVWSFVSERVNKKQFSVVPAQYDDGTWGFRVYTTSGTGVIMGTEGAFMTIMLNVADGVADGNYTILLKENKLSVKDADNNVTSVNLPDITSTLAIKNYKQGDVNDDGEIDLSDAIMVTYYSLHIEPSGFIRKVADMNGDGEIDLSDAIIIIFKSLGVLQARGLQTQGDALYSDDNLQITAGANGYSVSLTNEGRYLGMQCDIRLPEGMTLENVTLNGSRAEDHTVMWNETDEGCYRVVAFPMNGTPFFGNMGELFSFEVSGSQYGQVSMEHIFFVGTDLQKYHFDALSSQLTGVAEMNSERQKTSDDVYDLQGRKVTKRQKGLYLQGNKKYLVK